MAKRKPSAKALIKRGLAAKKEADARMFPPEAVKIIVGGITRYNKLQAKRSKKAREILRESARRKQQEPDTIDPRSGLL